MKLSCVPEGVSSVKPQGLGRDREQGNRVVGLGEPLHGQKGAGQCSPPTLAPDLLSEAQFP